MDKIDTIQCDCGEVYTARLHTWSEHHDDIGPGEPMGEYCDDDRCPHCGSHPADGKVLNSEDMVPEYEPDMRGE